MRRGIVVESGKRWTVLLTPDGEFIKIPSSKNHEEGKEIHFESMSITNQETRFKGLPKMMSGLAGLTACILILLFFTPLFGGSPAYAAVNIEINPSFELIVNSDARVTHVNTESPEGHDILKGIEWKNRRISDVTLSIVREAMAKGYIRNKEQQVLISSTFFQEKSKPLEENWTSLISQLASETQGNYTVILIEGKMSWLQEAKDIGVSPVAYMAVKHAQEQGVVINEENSELVLPGPIPGIKVLERQKSQESNETKESKPVPKGSISNQDQEKSKEKEKEKDKDKDKDKEKEKNKNKEERTVPVDKKTNNNTDNTNRKNEEKTDELKQDLSKSIDKLPVQVPSGIRIPLPDAVQKKAKSQIHLDKSSDNMKKKD